MNLSNEIIISSNSVTSQLRENKINTATSAISNMKKTLTNFELVDDTPKLSNDSEND